MRILYGVVGEGMGHAMRSAVLLEHLIATGHEIRIVVSGRAADYLEARYAERVVRITGLTMVYEDNVVRKLKTALENLRSIKDLPENFRQYAEIAHTFSPDVVISDFESLSYWFARGQRIPVISVDNMQVIARCHHDESVLEGDMKSFLLAKSIVKAKLPRCNHYLITTFFFPPVKKPRTTLHPPILRDIIVQARARTQVGDHVLVYQSGTSHDSLLEELRQVDAPFRIYGMRRGITEEQVEDNLTFCPFSEDRFTDDFASARAVIAGGGFTVMGEAVHLGKPMLSVPLRGQFEQILNSSYLAHLGYGERADAITSDAVSRFLDRAPRYAQKLAPIEHDGNAGLLRQLEEAIEAAVAEGARGVE